MLFKRIILPRNVMIELSKLKDFGFDMTEIEDAEWILVHTAADTIAVAELSQQLDPGESEAIVLAKELQADFLLMDERKGRKVANTLGIKTVGVLGILL